MSKQDSLKFQSCILKVNIHCDGCEHKVKKLLQKIDGVYTVSIDAAQGKVVVTGNVDPGKLIKKLKSSGKHAELWGQKGMMFPTNQFKNFQMDHPGKGGKDNKSHKGGKDQQKGGGQAQAQAQLFQFQHKGVKDLQLPSKDHKSVKFNLPEEEFYVSDDGFDDDDEYDDDFDDYDDEEDEEEHVHGRPMPNKMMNGHKGNSGGGMNVKKVDVMDLKGKGGKKESKNGGNGGKKGHDDGGKKHKGGGGGGGGGNKKDKKTSGGLLSRFLGFGQKGGDKNKNKKKGGGGGGGGNNSKGKEGKKGGGKFEVEGHDMDDDDFNAPHHHSNKGKGGQGGKGGKKSNGNGNVGQMAPNPMGHMDQMRNLIQGLPAMNGGGYYHGMQMQMQPPPPPPQYNPQQHYMATMMNHNHPQQPYLNNMYPSPHMMYGRPYMPPPPPPPIPVHPGADHVTHAFSDENTESCTIM